MTKGINDILIYIVLAIVIFVCLKIYYESDAFNLKCIMSGIDGQKYCVRERAKLELAADLLANVTKKCKELVEYVGKKYPDNEVYFNANIFTLEEGKIWYGDLDLTLDESNLTKIAKELNVDIYILSEMDGRFENEKSSKKQIIENSKKIIKCQ